MVNRKGDDQKDWLNSIFLSLAEECPQYEILIGHYTSELIIGTHREQVKAT